MARPFNRDCTRSSLLLACEQQITSTNSWNEGRRPSPKFQYPLRCGLIVVALPRYSCWTKDRIDHSIDKAKKTVLKYPA